MSFVAGYGNPWNGIFFFSNGWGAEHWQSRSCAAIMVKVNCPACGAEVIFRAAVSILAICDYCRSTLVRHDLNVENIGKMAALQDDGSVIQLGVEGAYRHLHFAVIGCIQLRFDAGKWNEWHLLFDDMKSGWMGEAQGNYAVSFLAEAADPLPPIERVSLGQTWHFQGKRYEVTNIDSAYCVSGAGELPFKVGAGYSAPVIDLAGEADGFATIDYSEDKPLLFLGEYVAFEQLKLTNLRPLDGW